VAKEIRLFSEQFHSALTPAELLKLVQLNTSARPSLRTFTNYNWTIKFNGAVEGNCFSLEPAGQDRSFWLEPLQGEVTPAITGSKLLLYYTIPSVRFGRVLGIWLGLIVFSSYKLGFSWERLVLLPLMLLSQAIVMGWQLHARKREILTTLTWILGLRSPTSA
jgi:hypothetical protein